ncbi:MAG TPA: hypothetical protein VNK95_16160 [Caldilineaceae bacterium]|nr:hypothetical protein [Caldilineaceae bacterium]
MNDRFTSSDLQVLIAYHGFPALSLYMPAHRITTNIDQDTIQFKNLLREAEEELAKAGVRRPDIQELLAPAQERLANAEFWRHQSDGLAVFLAPGAAHIYRLPLSFESLVKVGDNFHIKPLLPLLTNDGTFYILAVSKNAVRVLRGSKTAVDELDVETVPGSLAEALRFDDPERQLLFHTVSTPSSGGRGAALYHGHGGGATDDEKDRLLRYFRQIDKGLQDLLRDRQAPLIFAGVDYLLPIYQEANTYPHLMDEGITGNPDELRPEELHNAAWQIIAPHFARSQELALGTLGQMLATNQASTDIKEILPAAYNGRVETAFVPLYTQLWGVFNPELATVQVEQEESPENYDLYDQLAVYTLMRGGRVFALEQQILPNGADAAAIYRF